MFRYYGHWKRQEYSLGHGQKLQLQLTRVDPPLGDCFQIQQRQQKAVQNHSNNQKKYLQHHQFHHKYLQIQSSKENFPRKFGPQFVIHIKVQHDYRFSSEKYKLNIIEIICKAYCSFTQQKLPFYYTDDMILSPYTTTIDDLKKGKRKPHFSDPQFLDPQSFKKNENGKGSSKLIFDKKGDNANFNEFNLIKVLGKGAFGKVMLCQKQQTKQLFAVKSLRKENLIDKDQLEKTRTERKLLQISNHPFLVSLEYAFQTKEKIFFVMKFYKGGQLFHHLRKFKKFDQQQAKFYAAQILLGLEYLHQQGYIYRDLKPENILVDFDGYLKITDYGMAKHINQKLTYSIVGTPDYMAPQIIKNEGHSFPVDWWSFGILIYQMTHGFPPFYNRNQSKMFENILSQPVQIKTTNISKNCQNIIKELLIKDSQKRLGSQGTHEIKNHPWFESINFDDLLQRKIKAPFIPIVGNQNDYNNFDLQFTRQEAMDSILDPDLLLLKKYEQQFQGMTFVPQFDNK